MRLSIFHKISLSLLLSSLILLAGMGWLVNASFKEGLQSYINEEEIAKVESITNKLLPYYSDSFGWARLQQSPHLLSLFIQQVGEVPAPRGRPHGPPRPHGDTGHFEPMVDLGDKTLPNSKLDKALEPDMFTPLGMRLTLTDSTGNVIIGPQRDQKQLAGNQYLSRISIDKNKQNIGWILLVQQNQVSNKLARSFLYSQSQHMVTITIAALLLSLLTAFLLVRYILKPLRALHKGTEAVEYGDLEYVVQRNSNDEIGEIIDSFNQLTATLKQQKQMREQWLSDISHELRTPIAVLRGELEAMQDGIRPMTPQAIDSLHNQALSLTSLVNDLHTLSISDSKVELFGERQSITLTELIKPTCERFQLRLADKSITLLSDFEHYPHVALRVDVKRIHQVLQNLLENSYRYTDPNGMVIISIVNHSQHVAIIIEDSSPGVPSASLPKLFDRLYRVDKSRSRNNGGSGLGLSICQSIVKAHCGHISASHSELGGVKITLTLPK